MKRLSIWSMLLIMMCSTVFVACSSDDDGEGGSTGVKTCYIKIDGKQTDLKYAYYYGDEEGDNLIFTNIDMLYYYRNPGKITKGLIQKAVAIYSSEKFETGTTTNYGGFQYDVIDLYAQMHDTEGEYISYITEDETSCPIHFTINDGYYKIEATSMKLEAWDKNAMTGKTTADFYFEGTMLDASILYGDNIVVAKVDKPTMQWIKGIHVNELDNIN